MQFADNAGPGQPMQKSARAFAQADLGFCYPLTESVQWILLINRECEDQTALMCTLILTVCI